MSYLTITSKNNDRVKRVCLLAASPVQRRKQGLFVLEGLRLCRDAAQNGVRASEVYFRQDVADKFSDDLNLLINSADSAFLVGDDVFEKMSATESSQGVISVIDASALPNGCEPSASGRYVACENIADPSNLGAIARTAEALGCDGLILLGHCCDRLSPKSLRASMGALLRLPVMCFEDALLGADELKAAGLKLFASVVDPIAEPIDSVPLSAGSVAIIGNEANGISDALINASDFSFTIPIKGKAESFNAAAAASIIIWELMKR